MSLAVLNAANADHLIGRFDDAALIEKGGLHVLSFDAIRDRSGVRWPARQEMVREFIERQFEKHFRAADHLARLDDVNFLLIQPLESGFGAQGRALKLLGEVLQHFLGSSARDDVKLSRVLRITPEGVESAPVEVTEADIAGLAAMEWRSEPPVLSGPTSGPDTVQANPASSTSPRMAMVDAGRPIGAAPLTGDRTYEATFVVEPIWGIRQRAVVSYLLRPLFFEYQGDQLVDADLAKATVSDVLRLDLMVLAAAERLFQENSADTRFALHVPIHQASLVMAKGRQAILAALERFGPLASTSLIVVVNGLESGAPHLRILELTSVLARRCRAVVALAPDLDCRIDRWRDAHLSGVAVDLSPLSGAGEPLNTKRMNDFAARLKGVAPALFAYSVPNTAALLMAWSAGFTHVGGDLVLKRRSGPLKPLRLDPIDIYRKTA